jgi:hypothetical protein
MRKSFKGSLKDLQADIQHANTLACSYPREYDGGCLKMRLRYSPCAPFLMFLLQWTNCNLAAALGFFRLLVSKVYEDGKTCISVQERRASVRDFYGVIFPSLLELERGVSEGENGQQIDIKKMNTSNNDTMSEIELERNEECGICMEISSRVVLPNCYHCLCINCYRNWRSRSLSCPFCRDNLKRVNSGDLWIMISKTDTQETPSMAKEILDKLLFYIEKLPLVFPDPRLISYDPHYRLSL